MTAKQRVLVIGIDSAPLTLLSPWIDEGQLPTFARILKSGAYGDLHSRIPVTPVAWSSIYTGKNPGKHGIIGFRNHKRGTYEDVSVNSTLRNGRDVWEIAGSYGKKVVVVNGPLTYPPRPVNGYLVSGFMAPGTEHEFTYPLSLAKEVKSAVPSYRIGTAPSYMKGLYLKELNKTVQMVGDLALHLMKKIDWDLAFVVFKETDEVQHSFYDRPRAMLGLYQRVDRIAKEFLRLAGDNAYVFVVSDHGGEPVNKRFNVAEFLRREGLIRLNSGRRRKSTSVFQLVANAMFGMGMQWVLDLPGSRRFLSQIMKTRTRASEGNEGFYSGTIDWKNTTAFISSGIGLRINLKGREPQGLVEAGDYEAVRAKIARQFSEITDPETGENVFAYALPREQVLSGPYVGEAPDILCLPNTGYLPTEALASFDPIAVAATHRSLFSRSTLWCGTHSPMGLVAISGPGVGKSDVLKATLDDIAPTILYALGLPVPIDMDGRVLLEAFTPNHVRSHPVETSSVAAAEVSPRNLDEDEERKVEQRLRELGYLG